MKKIITITLLAFAGLTGNAQNSLLLNSDFEAEHWPEVVWVEQTNTGASVISNQSDTYFHKEGITANNGIKFAFLGGTQNASGIYEGEIGQQFQIDHEGNHILKFYLRVYRSSTDPANLIYISVDGEKVWELNTYYLVDIEDKYVPITINLGFLESGNHTISIVGYEYTLGGDTPMQIAFDDFLLTGTATSDINENENPTFNLTMTHGVVQINTANELNQNVVINVVDMNGKLITSQNPYFVTSHNLILDNLNTGMYIISIHGDGINYHQKLYIQG